MKFLSLLFLLSSSWIYANVKYCEDYFKSNPLFLVPEYNFFWSMDERGKFVKPDSQFISTMTKHTRDLSSVNYITEKDGTITLSRVYKDSRVEEEKERALQFTLDKEGRVVKVHVPERKVGITLPSETVHLKYTDQGVCYPEIHLMSKNLPITYTELCREFENYYAKNIKSFAKCIDAPCPKLNKVLSDMFNSYRERSFNGEKLTLEFYAIEDSKEKNFQFDNLAFAIYNRCSSYPGLVHAMHDENIWAMPSSPNNPKESKGDTKVKSK